jgi:hypothetical protein
VAAKAKALLKREIMKGLIALTLVGACGLVLASALARSGLPAEGLVRALCMLVMWLVIDRYVAARDALAAQAEVAALRKAELAALARIEALRAQVQAERAAHTDACVAHSAAMAEAHAAALAFERQRALLLPWGPSSPPPPSLLLSSRDRLPRIIMMPEGLNGDEA